MSRTREDEIELMRQPIIIGVAGGTGSGKTTVARNITREYGLGEVIILELDAYYRDLSHLPLEERARVNFDHPHSLEIELLLENLEQLQAGKGTEIPIYNFATHTRMGETLHVDPHRVIIVEGILALYFEELRTRLDLKIFVDTPADIRFIRRLRRDIRDRGRSLEAVIEQYRTTVRQMHEQFVEPGKYQADIILPEGGQNIVAIDLIKTKIDTILQHG